MDRGHPKLAPKVDALNPRPHAHRATIDGAHAHDRLRPSAADRRGSQAIRIVGLGIDELSVTFLRSDRQPRSAASA
jgi:phosphocarrier protein FPr